MSQERVLAGSESTSRIQGVLVGADGLRSRVGVLVLAGSSGRVDVVRARRRLTKRWEGSRGVRLFASLTSTGCGMTLATDWIPRACTRPLASLAAGEAQSR